MTKEFVQSEHPYGISTGHGWGAFVKDGNPWLEFAKENGIKPEWQNIKKIKRSKPRGVALGGGPKLPRRIYAQSPWTEWYDKRVRPETDWTLNKYKSLFKGRYPDWAKTFSQRHIDSTQVSQSRYKNTLKLPEEYRTGYAWLMERELYIPDKARKKKVLVERIVDTGGKVVKVTLLHLRKSGYHLIRTDERVDGRKWHSEKWDNCESVDLLGRNLPTLLKLPEPWSAYTEK
jgi:hypothetical protein